MELTEHTDKPASILHLYAELLLNIRTVTLFASLQTEHTAQTKAELSADGETITLTHEGEAASIRLPTQISGGGSATLTLPESPSKDLTLRLQLQEKSPGLLKLSQRGENVAPWDAGKLDECTRIACRACGQEMVAVGSEEKGAGVKRWLDLPNENWAEMMDFWHCHKPHEHHLPGHEHGAGAEKGYAASNRLTAKKGVGYVDLAYLLLSEADCPDVQPSHNQNRDTQRQQLSCSSCNATVGVADPRAEGWRIWKWSISVTRKSSSSSQTHSTPKWLSAQLFSLIENQGVRKFTVSPDSTNEAAEDEPITIWVFTPDLSFSSSVGRDRRTDPTRAMKVMWKPAPRPPPLPGNGLQRSGNTTESQAIDKQSLSVEELRLPAQAFEALKATLSESRLWLPKGAREFMEWHVGLLERFEDDDAE